MFQSTPPLTLTTASYGHLVIPTQVSENLQRNLRQEQGLQLELSTTFFSQVCLLQLWCLPHVQAKHSTWLVSTKHARFCTSSILLSHVVSMPSCCCRPSRQFRWPQQLQSPIPGGPTSWPCSTLHAKVCLSNHQ